MLTEQIIEFQLKGPGPSGRTCSPITGFFFKLFGQLHGFYLVNFMTKLTS